MGRQTHLERLLEERRRKFSDVRIPECRILSHFVKSTLRQTNAKVKHHNFALTLVLLAFDNEHTWPDNLGEIVTHAIRFGIGGCLVQYMGDRLSICDGVPCFL